MSEDTEHLRPRTWGTWAKSLISVLLHGYAAVISAGVIVACIADYDRHFPNPRFHLSPRYATLCTSIATIFLAYLVWRMVLVLRSLDR